MEISVWGSEAFVGAPLGDAHKTGGFGFANGHRCSIDSDMSGGVGLKLEIARFSFTVDCDCDGAILQPGDWIQLRGGFFLFVDVSSITYSLCGKTCDGSTGVGIRGVGLGLEWARIRWVVAS